MTDNEIVLNLLDFYKKRGIDLYKVLDDPTFKSLSRDTQLRAIQMYAERILHGTPAGIGKNDFKSMLNSTLMNAGLGAVSGAFTAAGLSQAFKGGSVPLSEALGYGAVFGGVSGGVGTLISSASKVMDRRTMRSVLDDVAKQPTSGNALNVLTANHLRSQSGDGFRKILDRVKGDIEKNYDAEKTKQIQDAVNVHNAGKQKF